MEHWCDAIQSWRRIWRTKRRHLDCHGCSADSGLISSRLGSRLSDLAVVSHLCAVNMKKEQQKKLVWKIRCNEVNSEWKERERELSPHPSPPRDAWACVDRWLRFTGNQM